MIIWSGFGFLTVVIVAVGMAVSISLGKSFGGLEEGYVFGIGLLIGAVGNWFAGRALNDPSRGREMIDVKTGQRIVFRPNHSLFWIPMQWWSVAAAVAGLVLIVMQATGSIPSGPPAKRADLPTAALWQG